MREARLLRGKLLIVRNQARHTHNQQARAQRLEPLGSLNHTRERGIL